MEIVSGFSKLSKDQKIDWLKSQISCGDAELNSIRSFWHKDDEVQGKLDDFSENTVGNFILPFGLAPNFIINEKIYTIPMVTEESSVVAAASKSAKFWSTRGGFKAKVISTTKSGQVHFKFKGSFEKLKTFFSLKKSSLLTHTEKITANMDKRGGGIKNIELVDKSDQLENYYQLDVKFETCDAMGANFINSVLENLGQNLKTEADEYSNFSRVEKEIDVIMCILSNYTPECIVRVHVECPIKDLGTHGELSASEFANKFHDAIQISKVDTSRAVTHNKGIFNGIDAVVIATGNDFRATSACGHAYAAKDGVYRGLTSCTLDDGIFKFEMTLPLAIGTVGGLTSLHPMSKISMKILENPCAKDLMSIIATAGLAQNYGAISSLVTTGIQKGHMKMHLLNILNQLDADTKIKEKAILYFSDKVISHASVREFLERQYH
jgi:hydroxymethylglutaryl-CoA reductase